MLLNHNIFLHVIATGLGPALAHNIWALSGISKILNGIEIPYSQEETCGQLYDTFPPARYVSKEVAIQLAVRAYEKSCRTLEGRLQLHEQFLTNGGSEFTRDAIRDLGGIQPVGVGVTGSVSTNREKKSPNAFCLAIAYNGEVFLWEDIRIVGDTREQQDESVSAFTLNSLEDILESHPLVIHDFTPPADYENLLAFDKPTHNRILFPVTANPLHLGHIRAAKAISNRTGLPVSFCFTKHGSGQHKGPQTPLDLIRKAAMVKAACKNFHFDFGFEVREGYLFLDLAQMDGVKGILAGSDAVDRMLDPKWYPEMNGIFDVKPFSVFNENGCKLYMSYRDSAYEEVGKKCRDLFGNKNFVVPVGQIGMDGVSSTELRIIRGWQNNPGYKKG